MFWNKVYQLKKENETRNKHLSKVFTNFVNDVVFLNFGLYWIIGQKEELYIDFEQNCPYWIQNYPLINSTVCSQMCGFFFQDLYITAKQNRYFLMFFINKYINLHAPSSCYVISGGDRLLPDGSKTYALKSLFNTSNLIEILLNTFEKN